MAVVEEAAVAVDRGISALLKNLRDVRAIECRNELCAARVLHAVRRPEDLRQTIEVDHLADFLSRMIRGEAAMIFWMPILCRDDQLKLRLELIDDRNDPIALRNRQRPAGAEVILKIDDDQRVHNLHI